MSIEEKIVPVVLSIGAIGIVVLLVWGAYQMLREIGRELIELFRKKKKPQAPETENLAEAPAVKPRRYHPRPRNRNNSRPRYKRSHFKAQPDEKKKPGCFASVVFGIVFMVLLYGGLAVFFGVLKQVLR